MSEQLEGRKVAFLVANEGVEQVELTSPWQAVEEAGGEPVLIAPQQGEVQGFEHLDKGDTFEAGSRPRTPTRAITTRWCCPGGVANPDILRTDTDAVELLARVLRGRQAGGGDLSCAVDPGRGRRGRGPDADVVAEPADRHSQRRRHWVDEEVHVDAGLVTSRYRTTSTPSTRSRSRRSPKASTIASSRGDGVAA